MRTQDRPRTRLSTWKAIAAYLECDERTAKRWEFSRSLPVHRLPGDTRGHVYALVSELTAWRARGADGENDRSPVPEPLRPAPKSASRTRRFAISGVGLGFVGILALWLLPAGPISHVVTNGDATSNAHAPSLAARQAYDAATLDWRRRTPDSLERAERSYRTAISHDPDYSAAYAGLANTYNLLREYTSMPASEAYPLAKANALRAIALDNRSSDAQAALGFAEYWGYWNVPKARQAFSQAVRLDPRNANAHHWYATFLANLGEEGAALQEIEAARVLDPQSTAIAADRGLLLVLAGRETEGIRILQALASSGQGVSSPLTYLASLCLRIGRYEEYLDASHRLAALAHDEDKMRAAGAVERAYRQGGPRALLARLVADRGALYANGQTSAFEMAALHSMMGDRKETLLLLRISAGRHESAFLEITNPLNFRELWGLPEFRNLVAQIQPLDG